VSGDRRRSAGHDVATDLSLNPLLSNILFAPAKEVSHFDHKRHSRASPGEAFRGDPERERDDANH